MLLAEAFLWLKKSQKMCAAGDMLQTTLGSSPRPQNWWLGIGHPSHLHSLNAFGISIFSTFCVNDEDDKQGIL